jgi:Type II secretory pathway, component PulK
MRCERPHPSGGSRRAASGFVLAVTLWILAGIAIAVALMTLWARSQVEEAHIGRERLQDELAFFGTRDTLLYLAATRELNRAGLPVEPMSEEARALQRLSEFGGLSHDPVGGELRLDDAPYLGLAGTRFSLQDEAGLYSVVLPPARSIERLLEGHGVEPERIPGLRDALLDYLDADDLRRLNGAERREYERARLPPPPNRRLLTPGELARVMGWERLPREQLERLVAHITPYYAGATNLNTAPESLLPVWLDGCPETCARLVAERRRAPFRNGYEVQDRLGIVLPGEPGVDYRFLADEGLVMTLWGRTGIAWRMHVRLTPLAAQRGPWSILAAYPIPRPRTDELPADTGSALFADPAVARQ